MRMAESLLDLQRNETSRKHLTGTGKGRSRRRLYLGGRSWKVLVMNVVEPS